MTTAPEPLLKPVEIDTLRPTQMTVGFAEVARKRAHWRKQAEIEGSEFLGQHMLPAVKGPNDRYWIIDNHHLARALHDEGVKHVLVRIVADLSAVKTRLFKTYMDNRNWLHPFDAEGHRCPVDELPKHVKSLADDPYRSLAGSVRRAGGYAKDVTPYSEFLWADFFRARIKTGLLAKEYDAAVAKALLMSQKKDAAYLPGWSGPDD